MIGEIIQFAGSTAPEHYLLCDGSAVSRTVYADLFSVIGTSYGDGDGTTTFNLPNLVDKTPLGVSNSHLLGSNGGANEITLTEQTVPAHTHEVAQHGHSNDIAVSTPTLVHSITTLPSVRYTKLNGSSSKASFGTATTRNTGGGTATTMTRSTNFAVASHAATACTMSGGVTDCPAFDTENAGGGLGHNNMMPYLSLLSCICYYDVPPVPPTPSMLFYNGAMVATAGGGYIAGQL